HLGAVDPQAAQQSGRVGARRAVAGARRVAGRGTEHAAGPLARDDLRAAQPADDRRRECLGLGLGRLDVGDALERVPHGATLVLRPSPPPRSGEYLDEAADVQKCPKLQKWRTRLQWRSAGQEFRKTLSQVEMPRAIRPACARPMDTSDDAVRDPREGPEETYNPWSIVNLVFRHLADE